MGFHMPDTGLSVLYIHVNQMAVDMWKTAGRIHVGSLASFLLSQSHVRHLVYILNYSIVIII